MKILLVTHQFFPNYYAGTETLTLQTAKYFQANGHDVTILTAEPQDTLPQGSLLQEDCFDNLRVLRYPQQRVATSHAGKDRMRSEYLNPWGERCFAQALDAVQPDCVHFFHLARVGISAIDICKQRNIPCFWTATDYWAVCPSIQLRLPDNEPCTGPDANSANCLQHIAFRTLPPTLQAVCNFVPKPLFNGIGMLADSALLKERRYFADIHALRQRGSLIRARLRQFDKIFCSTRFMQELFQKNGLYPGNMQFLPFGFDASSFIRRTRMHARGSVLKLGFIGSIYEHKGPHVLIDALKQLPRDTPVNLKLYGDVHEFPQYAAQLLATSQNDSRITFMGKFPTHEFGRVMDEIDALVVPSIWHENTPLVVYAAQAAACPVIGSDVAGIAEVIHHDKNGLLFEKGNAQALAAQIRTLTEQTGVLTRLSEGTTPPGTMAQYAQSLLTEFRLHVRAS